MIIAIAVLEIHPDKTDDIEDVCRKIAAQYNEVEMPQGLHSWGLVRSREDPNTYIIHGHWDKAEDHTGMADTDFGQQMTELIQACCADSVIHHCTLIEGSEVGPTPLVAA
jgi:quinol monooxygenase YgiN